MRRLRTTVGIVFVFAYLVYGDATVDGYCSPYHNPYCSWPTCSDSNSCFNGNYWATRSCSWDESFKISCGQAWMFMQTDGAGCGPGPWYGYVNEFDCYDTSEYPQNCGPMPPWDPDQCQSVGSASCSASTGYC